MLQVERFIFKPGRSQEEAPKLIGRHLLGTKNNGLVINSNRDYKIGVYPGADFLDPTIMKILVIMFVLEAGHDMLSMVISVLFFGRVDSRLRLIPALCKQRS